MRIAGHNLQLQKYSLSQHCNWGIYERRFAPYFYPLLLRLYLISTMKCKDIPSTPQISAEKFLPVLSVHLFCSADLKWQYCDRQHIWILSFILTLHNGSWKKNIFTSTPPPCWVKEAFHKWWDKWGLVNLYNLTGLLFALLHDVCEKLYRGARHELASCRLLPSKLIVLLCHIKTDHAD